MFQYQLISFQPIDPPDNNHQDEWYQYVIANKFNRITGYRSGTQDDVKDYVNKVIDYQNQKLFIISARFEKQANCEAENYLS